MDKLDKLDQIILNAAERITIKSKSVTVNECNFITVEFGVRQEESALKSEPWSRLTQWMIMGLYSNNQKLAIHSIPETIDANEVADWLAEELVKNGKVVLLMKLLANGSYETVTLKSKEK